MSASVKPSSLRTPAESIRTDLQRVRAGSQPLRIDAKAEFLAVINEVRTRLGKSVEAMALDADCPTSSMSDALAGKEGRNFAGHWLTAQGDDFIKAFNDEMESRHGLTEDAADRAEAETIGQLVTAILTRSFRARRSA